MRYVVLGANGQLGQAFLRLLGADAVGLTRSQADLTDAAQLRPILASLRPGVVLNCAAYNLVDKAESDMAPPFAVNTWGVRDLARLCQELRCTLVHYSTNYVFGLDHAHRTPLAETDLPGPEGVYATSKLAGEFLARIECEKHFVIRTCGLYGQVKPETGSKPSFADLMLRLAAQGKPIRVVNDQICSPTRTDELASASLRLLDTAAYGLYHLTSSGECSWHEFARAIFEITGIKAELQGVDSTAFAAAARRPAYSVLANAAYARLGFTPIGPWRDALVDYLRTRS